MHLKEPLKFCGSCNLLKFTPYIPWIVLLLFNFCFLSLLNESLPEFQMSNNWRKNPSLCRKPSQTCSRCWTRRFDLRINNRWWTWLLQLDDFSFSCEQSGFLTPSGLHNDTLAFVFYSCRTLYYFYEHIGFYRHLTQSVCCWRALRLWFIPKYASLRLGNGSLHMIRYSERK